jgi:hypothetical protein
MEAILKFSLPEDHTEFDLAIKGGDWYHAMWELNQWLRVETKHPAPGMSDDTYNALVNTRDKLYEILNESGLKL